MGRNKQARINTENLPQKVIYKTIQKPNALEGQKGYTMQRNEAINTIKTDLPRIIWQRDKSRTRYPGYICPICGSGSGKNGTGISTKDGIHYTCWAGCFTNQDVLSIIGLQTDTTDFNRQLEICCEQYGIDYRTLEADNGSASKSTAAGTSAKATEEPQADYSEFYISCVESAEACDYLQKRGISIETQKNMCVGYCKEWKHPKAPNAPASPRIIIPTSSGSYLARDTRSELTEEQKKYAKSKVGSTHIFNLDALQRATSPVFITEGEIDALSFLEVGYKAVGLGSVNMIDKLVSFLSANPTKATLLIALDNDAPGQEAAQKLHAKLNTAAVTNYIVNPHEGYKDANEALQADRRGFTAKCKECIEQPNTEALQAEIKAQEAYLSTCSVIGKRKAYESEIEANISLPTTSTGYSGLDEALNGGLVKGLYFIGGISSIGKTTFCMQIADNIAKNGQDVLIFALEMATNELIAKSVSRYTYFKDLDIYKDTRHAKSTAAVLYDRNKNSYSAEEKSVLEAATNAYFDEIAPHLFIHEGVGDIGVEKIREEIETHIKITGNKPVVFIDYLQILAPYDSKATDKQNTDKAVLELKRISRDNAIPVIAISSFNRESYTQSVTMASFKESGAVEYTSDVLMGLQYYGMDRQNNEKDGEYSNRVREERERQEENGRTGKPQHLQIKVLKNRNGRKGSAELMFLPAFNYFYEENPFTNNGYAPKN